MTTITVSSTYGLTIVTPAYTGPLVVDPGVTIANIYNGPALLSTFWPGIIQNDGTIDALHYSYGIESYGGTLFNAATAVISGFPAVRLSSGTAVGGVTLVNGGTIVDPRYGGSQQEGEGTAVYFGRGPAMEPGIETMAFVNATNALISATYMGVNISSGTGNGTNAGTIAATRTFGVGLLENAVGGSFTNTPTGTIVGGSLGVKLTSPTLINEGTIEATSSAYTRSMGVDMLRGFYTSFTNEAGGIVIGSDYGVYDGGSVVNAGTIGIGTAVGVGVANGIGIGTVHPLTVAVINEATGTISGTYGIRLGQESATVVNAGAVTGTGGTALAFRGTGSNRLILDPGYSFSGVVAAYHGASNALELAAGTIAGTVNGLGTEFLHFQTMNFDPGADWFALGSAASLPATITGFAHTDTIQVTGFTATSSSFAGGVLTLDSSGATATLDVGSGFSLASFIVQDVAAGTDVSVVACFAEGTCILTTCGEIPVDQLATGARVVTASGAIAPIAWIGRRRLDLTRHRGADEVRPVRITAGSLPGGGPHRDLVLSPDHALLIEGALIPVRYLVNGRTIRHEDRVAITYFHVELARHDAILAEGAACETYLDTGNRRAFEGTDALILHPDFACAWNTDACAPLVLDGPPRTAARRAILAHAAQRGLTTTSDPDLCMVAGDRVLHATRRRDTWHVALPTCTTAARLLSRTWIPAHTHPDEEDTRTLGIAVKSLALDGKPIAEHDLGEGWHAAEPEWRWTNGRATINTKGAKKLTFRLALTGTYWNDCETMDAAVSRAWS